MNRHPFGIKKDYVIIGGMVRSRKTGKQVYASPEALAQVYGIDPKKAVLQKEMTANVAWRMAVAYWFLPVMRPRNAGDYAEVKKRVDEEYGYAKS